MPVEIAVNSNNNRLLTGGLPRKLPLELEGDWLWDKVLVTVFD
jgi:hypothetical protein